MDPTPEDFEYLASAIERAITGIIDPEHLRSEVDSNAAKATRYILILPKLWRCMASAESRILKKLRKDGKLKEPPPDKGETESTSNKGWRQRSTKRSDLNSVKELISNAPEPEAAHVALWRAVVVPFLLQEGAGLLDPKAWRWELPQADIVTRDGIHRLAERDAAACREMARLIRSWEIEAAPATITAMTQKPLAKTVGCREQTISNWAKEAQVGNRTHGKKYSEEEVLKILQVGGKKPGKPGRAARRILDAHYRNQS